jgi:hypothetical protein
MKSEVAAAVFDVLHAIMDRYPLDADLSDRVKTYEEILMQGMTASSQTSILTQHERDEIVKVLGILADRLREDNKRRARSRQAVNAKIS